MPRTGEGPTAQAAGSRADQRRLQSWSTSTGRPSSGGTRSWSRRSRFHRGRRSPRAACGSPRRAWRCSSGIPCRSRTPRGRRSGDPRDAGRDRAGADPEAGRAFVTDAAAGSVTSACPRGRAACCSTRSAAGAGSPTTPARGRRQTRGRGPPLPTRDRPRAGRRASAASARAPPQERA